MGQTQSLCDGHNPPCLLKELDPFLPGFNLLQLTHGYRRGLGMSKAELHSQLCQRFATKPEGKQPLGFVLPQFNTGSKLLISFRELCEVELTMATTKPSRRQARNTKHTVSKGAV